MDKDVQTITDALINTELSGATVRFLAHYVLQLVGELYDKGVDVEVPSWSADESKRMRAFCALVLKDENVKNMFCKVLDLLKRKRDEIVESMLKQYGMFYGNEHATYYHDKICVYFDKEIEVIKTLIKDGNFREIYSRTSYGLPTNIS